MTLVLAALLAVAQTPPEPYSTLIRGLGAPCYTCREIATKKLQRLAKVDARWVVWASHTPRDPEIRHRARVILLRLKPCVVCHGTGWVTNYRQRERDGGTEREDSRCPLCGGTGHAR